MLGRAQNGEVLHITKIVCGDGAASQPSDLWPLTALKSFKMNVVISTKRDYGQGTLLVEGSLRSDQAPSAFYLKEVGIMAHIGAEADQLYSVANVFSDPPDYIDPAAPTIEVFKIKLIVDRIPTANLVVQIGPSENVTGSNIGPETVGPGWFRDALGNVLNFKRVIIGTGMEIYETPISPGGDAIYIGIKTLHNDLDVYVPASYPNLPPGALTFPTVQQAHDYLIQFVIPPDKFARIHVGPNILSSAVTIQFTHPNSRQISLIGMPRVDYPITQIVATGAPLGSSKDLAIANTAGLVAGQIAYVYNTLTNWMGGVKILSVRPNAVTVSHFRKEARLPVNTATETGGTMRLSHHPSQLVNTNPGAYNTLDPVISFPFGIHLCQNMAFEGAGYILNCADSTAIQDCQTCGGTGGTSLTFGKRGINHYVGGAGLIGENVFSNTAWGIISFGVFTAFEQTIINGCQFGIQASNAGCAVGSITGNMPNAIVQICHCQRGIMAGNFIGGTIFYAENDYGMYASGNGTISVGAAYASYPSNNTIDLYAENLSFIHYNRWGAANPSCDPPAGNLDLAESNHISFIEVVNS